MPRGGLDDSSFRPKNKVENQYLQARLAQPYQMKETSKQD